MAANTDHFDPDAPHPGRPLHGEGQPEAAHKSPDFPADVVSKAPARASSAGTLKIDLEVIEAGLCDYLDGTLDDRGRADVERHLAANPQYRYLLEDLKRTQVMLRELPRVAAPADLMEPLHTQMERTSLLGNEGDGAGLRIRQWHRIITVAAILTMAVGLGVVIYFLLPAVGDHPADQSSFALKDHDTDYDGAKRDEMKEGFGGTAGLSEDEALRGRREGAVRRADRLFKGGVGESPDGPAPGKPGVTLGDLDAARDKQMNESPAEQLTPDDPRRGTADGAAAKKSDGERFAGKSEAQIRGQNQGRDQTENESAKSLERQNPEPAGGVAAGEVFGGGGGR